MHPANEQAILKVLGASDVVLDIGGWACPFNRANYVLDAEPFDTRGFYKTIGLRGSQGGDREYFTSETWIRRDICDKTPFSFPDKMFDFVICSHTLEDVRDPLWVCSEIVRVGKRGYIEVPSRLMESTRGWESPRTAGLSHHRWLIDMDQEAAHVRFLHKHHMIHAERRFSLPPSSARRLSDEEKISWLFWYGAFTTAEVTLHGVDAIAAELERYVRIAYSYPAWLLAGDRALARLKRLDWRVAGRFARGWRSAPQRR